MNYADSFSFEWATHNKTQLDSVSGLGIAEHIFFERTGFTPESIKGKLVLDAGCGVGRFMEIVKKYGGIPVGLDMSTSVVQSKENVQAEYVQGDIIRPPFQEKSFDLIYSIGVLHHTRNTRQAFESLVPLLKDGGTIAVWLYSDEGIKQHIYNMVTDFWRRISTRMSTKSLYNLCKMSIPLYYVHKSPLGIISRAVLPTSMEKLPEWRVLDTFDWYSPKYQTKHTYKEIVGWFQDSGLKNIKCLSFPISVSGEK